MPRLNQTITRWQGMGLIATTLLGTGVFILPQLTIVAAGNKAIWAWVILLLGILPLTWVFAQLGRRFTHAAGPAYFVERAFGPLASRVIGLLFLFSVPPGAAAALVMTFKFLEPIISLSAEQQLGGELLIFLLLFYINRRGLQLSGRIQMGLTLTILLVVALMLVTTLIQAPITDVTPIMSQSVIVGDYSGLMQAIGLGIWSFLGIEAVTHLAGEFKDVQKDYIPATLTGVLLVGLIYIGCTWLSMWAPEHPLAMVGLFELQFGNSGRWIIGGLGFISGIATINIYFASLSRLAWSFSHDGILPHQLRSLNQYRVPTTALITFILISALMLLLSYLARMNFTLMAHWVNGSFVVVYSASMLAAWKLLDKRCRPAIAISLIACGMFIYCLGSAMLYALLLGLLITMILLGQPLWKQAHPADENLKP
ncbi:L-methionine/branched-chain amino acid transporter [Amphritea pacifica]|uniref:L-methionine/branched-chain amino acid transporter n=1 Tax=Amphritea pacifica TaxID=2811233 RepID=A0ABS2W748_9GAMM|nr:L-methionine/branched-chain amino acid transporter [Amphritea pacifica]MBN0987342.1 L-methionine/branched-chain amino acid transporter [Amphritea pacifica]